MIKVSYFVAVLAAVFCVAAFNNMAVSYPDGPPTNRCGLYGTQPTCTTCHSASGTNNATATVSIAGNPTSYTPGQVYAITVAGTGGLSYGFELACVRSTDGANAGTFASSTGTEMASGTVTGNSISFIRHSTPNNAGTWTFNWTAPTNVGSVAFYLAILATNTNNGTGSNSGDKTKTATLTLNAPACAAPATPTGLTTTNITATTATFNWNAVSGAANYTIQGRKVGTTNWVTIGPVTGTSKTVSSQLVACKSYEWQVKASCSTGGASSAFSPSTTFTTTCKTDETMANTSSFTLSPNPATTSVSLNYNTNTQSQISIRVVAITGKTVWQQTAAVVEGENSLVINTDQLSQGYYVVEITDGTTKMHQKLLISK